jgi:hypothetical protein
MSTNTWIIEYRSPRIKQPIYFLWYTDTDENSTDRLFTFRTGEIFAASSLPDIKKIITANFTIINEFDKLQQWLDEFDSTVPPELTFCDINTTYQSVKAEKFDIKTLECLTNFINLFGDYVNQDPGNEYLRIFSDNEFVREAWDYFYNFTFWPRFNDKEKFETWDRPPFITDTKDLIDGIDQLIKNFEDNIIIKT